MTHCDAEPQFPADTFPSVAAVISDGITRGLHTGVQIAVLHHGQCVLDSALGRAAPGQPLSRHHRMLWRSAGKPLTALLVLQLLDDGRLELDSELADLLPATSSSDKARVTVRDLLAHQSGFPDAPTGWPDVEWDESVRRTVDSPRSLDIGVAAYHPQSSWFLLGEILRRHTGENPKQSFTDVLSRRLLQPAGLDAVSCGVNATELTAIEACLPAIYERQSGALAESPYAGGLWLSRPSPGGNLRGPVRQLAEFYEILRCGGRTRAGKQVLSESSAGLMTRRHRVGQFDRTLQHTVDFGLGVLCDSRRYGADTVPYGFGRYCSEAAFGHGGSQCSMGFCDPEQELSVAWAANGFCGEPQHQRRNRAINEAVCRDLGLA